MSVAIIPARGGSKRIPRKNLRLFRGRPMICWSIQAALEAGVFQRVIVSTDDPEIADVAIRHGAEVPFMRPAHLADDFATTADVMQHAAEWLRQNEFNVPFICCIYATAPFVRSRDLQTSHGIMQKGSFDYVFSGTSFSYPIFRALRGTEEGGVQMLFPENATKRSQDLPEAFHDAGQFYWGKTDSWLLKKPIFGLASNMMILPRWRVQDLDTPEDWTRAEMMASVIENHHFED